MEKARIGFAKACITPPLGTQLAGHFALDRRAQGVHDDLFTRVVVLEFNQENYCIIQNDLIGLDYDFVESYRPQLVELGFKEEHIFIGCTHTHSGPSGLTKRDQNAPEHIKAARGAYNEDLVQQYQQTIKATVAEALTNKDYCSMRYGTTEVRDVCSNRNFKEKPGDPLMLALEFIREDGQRILIYDFSCHPTVVNHGNYQITADFPHGVAKLTEDTDRSLVLFFNGSSGDVSTRFTRREASFAEIDRIGAVLLEHIETALAGSVSEDITEVAVWSASFPLAYREVESVEAAQAKYDRYEKELNEALARGEKNKRTYESFVEGARFNLFRSQSFTGGDHTDIKFKLLKLNDLTFVFVPSELFSDLSNPLKEKYAGKLFFVTHFGGSNGYIADKASYDADTYETQTSNFARGQGEEFIAAVEKALLEFWGK